MGDGIRFDVSQYDDYYKAALEAGRSRELLEQAQVDEGIIILLKGVFSSEDIDRSGRQGTHEEQVRNFFSFTPGAAEKAARVLYYSNIYKNDPKVQARFAKYQPGALAELQRSARIHRETSPAGVSDVPESGSAPAPASAKVAALALANTPYEYSDKDRADARKIAMGTVLRENDWVVTAEHRGQIFVKKVPPDNTPGLVEIDEKALVVKCGNGIRELFRQADWRVEAEKIGRRWIGEAIEAIERYEKGSRRMPDRRREILEALKGGVRISENRWRDIKGALYSEIDIDHPLLGMYVDDQGLVRRAFQALQIFVDQHATTNPVDDDDVVATALKIVEVLTNSYSEYWEKIEYALKYRNRITDDELEGFRRSIKNAIDRGGVIMPDEIKVIEQALKVLHNPQVVAATPADPATRHKELPRPRDHEGTAVQNARVPAAKDSEYSNEAIADAYYVAMKTVLRKYDWRDLQIRGDLIEVSHINKSNWVTDSGLIRIEGDTLRVGRYIPTQIGREYRYFFSETFERRWWVDKAVKEGNWLIDEALRFIKHARENFWGDEKKEKMKKLETALQARRRVSPEEHKELMDLTLWWSISDHSNENIYHQMQDAVSALQMFVDKPFTSASARKYAPFGKIGNAFNVPEFSPASAKPSAPTKGSKPGKTHSKPNYHHPENGDSGRPTGPAGKDPTAVKMGETHSYDESGAPSNGAPAPAPAAPAPPIPGPALAGSGTSFREFMKRLSRLMTMERLTRWLEFNDPFARKTAVWFLGWRLTGSRIIPEAEQPGVVDAIRKRLDDRDSEVRVVAAQMLGAGLRTGTIPENQREGVIEALEKRKGDEDEKVREAAKIALTPTATVEVTAGSEDPAEAAGPVSNQDLTPLPAGQRASVLFDGLMPLLESGESGDRMVHEGAVRVLGGAWKFLGKEQRTDLFNALKKCLESDDSNIRYRTVEALGGAWGYLEEEQRSELVSALMPILSSATDSRDVRGVIRALGGARGYLSETEEAKLSDDIREHLSKNEFFKNVAARALEMKESRFQQFIGILRGTGRKILDEWERLGREIDFDIIKEHLRRGDYRVVVGAAQEAGRAWGSLDREKRTELFRILNLALRNSYEIPLERDAIAQAIGNGWRHLDREERTYWFDALEGELGDARASDGAAQALEGAWEHLTEGERLIWVRRLEKGFEHFETNDLKKTAIARVLFADLALIDKAAEGGQTALHGQQSATSVTAAAPLLSKPTEEGFFDPKATRNPVVFNDALVRGKIGRHQVIKSSSHQVRARRVGANGLPKQSLGQVLARLFFAGRNDLKAELEAAELTAEQKRRLIAAGAKGPTLIAIAERIVEELSSRSSSHPVNKSAIRATGAVRGGPPIARPPVVIGR